MWRRSQAKDKSTFAHFLTFLQLCTYFATHFSDVNLYSIIGNMAKTVIVRRFYYQDGSIETFSFSEPAPFVFQYVGQVADGVVPPHVGFIRPGMQRSYMCNIDCPYL